MGELGKHLNPIPETVQRIYDWHKQRGDAEPRRGYLGASIIGHACDRFLWYTFRGCVKSDISGRVYRLFETGDLEEARFVKELRGIGCTVHDLDPETGEQFEVMALGGHLSGHMDGCALNIPEAPKTWHVLEFKTHAAKYFNKVVKENNIQSAFPMHYAQMQIPMGLTGMKRAFYLARNKDTDHLHSERVRYDAEVFKGLMDRAERIIRTNVPPERLTGRSDDFRCKFCDAHALCWGDLEEAAVPIPDRNCETCCHATPELTGVYEDTTGACWTCDKAKRDITPAERQQGCDGHLLLPGLVWFADPVDKGDGWIEFENHAGRARWRHGYGKGLWTTTDLMRSQGGAVGTVVDAVKAVFGGTCERTSLVDRYAPDMAERLWDGIPEKIGEAVEKLELKIDTCNASRHEDDGATEAWEYASADGENDICIVVYIDDNYAAIWKGKT